MKSIAFLSFMAFSCTANALDVDLPDYSYICFSHDAAYDNTADMVKSLKFVNTIGVEQAEPITPVTELGLPLSPPTVPGYKLTDRHSIFNSQQDDLYIAREHAPTRCYLNNNAP